MSDFSSDSDCFESADEEFDYENIFVEDSVKSGKVKSGSGPVDSVGSAGDSENPASSEENRGSGRAEREVQYRKRPERRKNLPRTETASTRKISLNDQIFKSQIMKSDVLIQDITSNLSKNFNKGFNTIQQTSSSIKDLVIGSLPVKASTECTRKFSYDEDMRQKKEDEKEEEEEEEEIASYLPECKEDCFQNNNECGKETSILSDDSVKDFVKLEEKKLQPCVQLCKDKTQSKVQAKEMDNHLCQDVELVQEIKHEEHMLQKTIKDILKDDIEESEEVKCLDETNDLSEGVKNEINEHVSDLELNIKTGENLVDEIDKVKGNEMKSILKDELKYSNPEINDDNFRLKSEDIEDNQKGTDDNNDGWDTFDHQLEDLDGEESSGTSSVQNRNVNEDVISPGDEDAVLENPASSCNEGWDDFDFDDDDFELSNVAGDKPKPLEKYEDNQIPKSEARCNYSRHEVNDTKNVCDNNKWSGWDSFGEKQETKQKSGWTLSNWGVNAILNTATSVTQGLSTVLEAGLGAPDPETLAKMEIESIRNNNENRSHQKENLPSPKSEESSGSSVKLFPDFGITNLVAGVTKNIVEHTKVHEIGSKVISGGLDTLESFGKKTMEVLQEGDPGLKKKRALLLGTNKPTLSLVLREAKAKAEMENKKMEEQKMAKLCHFETLFDDFQGLVHLEALEMLSRQCELKLEQMKESLSLKELEDMNDTLDEVKELCVIDEDEFKIIYSGLVDFKISLTKAVESLQNEISVQKIVQIYEEFNIWLKSDKVNVKSSVNLFEKAMSVLAELTAATVQQYHKGGELLSVKEHRKTVEEADALLQMTGVVCCEINQMTEKVLELYRSEVADVDLGIEKKIKEESSNATSYIKDAFNLLIPVLQLGATT